ncbi:hypothetical protein BLAHAN_04516 [Blautia hansenii DSM 20583]|uniref:Uncharacterized protein n=1 Tax=Blautia hansenii DSM 20583 TaxID=537007 RepID=C9L566_BLAHA|nr:hypothetical protein BLAHAN_04516 [Blautia hansenii DSM 20583]
MKTSLAPNYDTCGSLWENGNFLRYYTIKIINNPIRQNLL